MSSALWLGLGSVLGRLSRSPECPRCSGTELGIAFGPAIEGSYVRLGLPSRGHAGGALGSKIPIVRGVAGNPRLGYSPTSTGYQSEITRRAIPPAFLMVL